MLRMTLLSVAMSAILFCNCSAQELAAVRDGKAGCLSFEDCPEFGRPDSWGGGPIGTIARDTSVAHSGRASGRITREGKSGSQFSALTMMLPVDFEGRTLELRGWLRLEDVKGWAGLWQRQDGASPSLQFDKPLLGLK